MQTSDSLAALLPRVEPVHWYYDGLNGKVIEWSMAHGNTNHDPSILVWLVGADGEPTANLTGNAPYNAGSFTKWLDDELTSYERDHPRTRVPLVRTKVVEKAGESGGTWHCPALDDALAADTPTVLYVGRDQRDTDDKAAKKQVKLARTFEKKVLGSKKAAEAAEPYALLRIDLADEGHRAFASTLGVTEAPAMLLWRAGAEAPETLDRRTTGPGLAILLKKALEPVAEPEPAGAE